MSCNYAYQGAKKENGRPPGDVSELHYWRRQAHIHDHEAYHHMVALKAAKNDAKKKRRLLKDLLEVMVEEAQRKKAKKENRQDKRCLCETYLD